MTDAEQPKSPEIDGPSPRVPMFNVPSVVLAALMLLWLVQFGAAFVFPQSLWITMIVEGGFIPLRYSVSLSEQSLAWLWSPVTYSFIHGGWSHIIVNSIWLAAFGSIVARRIGVRRFVVFWVLTAVCAVAFHTLFHIGDRTPVIGASGVVSGLMGAAARFAFPQSGRLNREKAHFLPRQSIVEAMTNRTVVVYLAVWFGISLISALGYTAGAGAGQNIAWEAHIGGFLAGFLGFGLIDRPKWT